MIYMIQYTLTHRPYTYSTYARTRLEYPESASRVPGKRRPHGKGGEGREGGCEGGWVGGRGGGGEGGSEGGR